MRCNVFISILKSLWEDVEKYRALSRCHDNFSRLTEDSCEDLLVNPRPLIRTPRRRPGQYGLGKYQKKRTYISIDPNFLTQLRDFYEKETGKAVDTSVVVESALFYFCSENGVDLTQKEYFEIENYQELNSVTREELLSAFHRLQELLGRIPTSRDWTKYRANVEAPSLKVALAHFGTFNELKREAQPKES